MSARHEEVIAWLRKGHADLLSARILIEHGSLVSGPAAFHCQQAAEKALKAFLVWRSVPFERVHSLVYLMDLCEQIEPGFAELREETETLSPYATAVRYPGDLPDISPEEACTALAAAEAVWSYALGLLPPGLRDSLSSEDAA